VQNKELYKIKKTVDVKQICFNFSGLFAINLLYSFYIFSSIHILFDADYSIDSLQPVSWLPAGS